MSSFNGTNSSSILSCNTKIQAIESTLQQSLVYFKDLLLDFEQLHIESENYKTQFITQKVKCESKTCSSSEALKKVIESKNHIIQLVASTLTTLNETKNFNILKDAFEILCGETNTITHDEDSKFNTTTSENPKKEPNDSITEEIFCKDESVSEIDGTPTGRTSPIIQTKKLKSAVEKSSDFRDKKKCPHNWSTPEKKTIKLSYPTPTRAKPNGRLRQGRLNLVKVKQTNMVDLTCSPEFSGGSRGSKSESDRNVQPLIKRDSVENDDTILPSPTSGPTNFTLFTSTSKGSPVKFKKPNLSLKMKREKMNLQDIENHPAQDTAEMANSINILNQLPKRFPNGSKKQSPVKYEEPIDEDATHCETILSMSLLQDVNKLESIKQERKECSPIKPPLAENINIANTPSKSDDAPNVNKMAAVDNVKRKIPELVEPLYKEPTVRKKSEKRALPGWCCEECKYFFGELYKDDPVMMAKKIAECSKHRGRNNPARPKTPPNFWNPRWDVPEDTEELNRMNNAV